MSGYEELRHRHLADYAALLPDMVARIDWPADRLSEFRLEALRRLLGTAIGHSSWHRKRLADLDLAEIDEGQLSELPVMTKEDLMEHFDEVVTDPRLCLDSIEAHLDGLANDAYLFDRFRVCSSGGSTGRRGVFVYDWDAWATSYASTVRYELRLRSRNPDLAAAPPQMVMIGGDDPRHLSRSLFQTFSTPDVTWHRFPVTMPVEEVVAALNQVQPTVLCGYPSGLYVLAHEANEGRLRIQPLRVISGAEQLLPEIRQALSEAWHVPVANWWGASETGIVGLSCGESPFIHLSDDLVIIEPVDEAGRPVPPGVRSAKIFVTNLYNPALPLIRYEITDEFTFLDTTCPCGSPHRCMSDPGGRLDEGFDYGDVRVHPHVFRSPLGRCRHVLEYQVRQTPNGAVILVLGRENIDTTRLAADISDELAGLGLESPAIEVRRVERIDRQASGKLRRFIPLG